MSRNRCSTSCECEHWRFQEELSPDDRSLLTFEQYTWMTSRQPDWPLRTNGTSPGSALDDAPGELGHGFESRRNGIEDPYWRTADGGGRNFEPDVDERQLREWIYDPWVYATVPPAERYRYRCERCPTCRRMYLVYYRLYPWAIKKPYGAEPDKPLYRPYDSSYWWSFNDEPSDDDLIDVLHWTREHVVRALTEYAARHPELTSTTEEK